jgi:hypothetical protein
LTLFALIALAHPDLTHLFYAASTIVVLIPIALLMGIVRFSHFDIDRILSTTAVLWLSLTVSALVVATFASVLSGWTSYALGWPNWMTNAGAAGVMSLLVVAVARWLNPWLDSRLFVERAALQAGLSHLLSELTRTTDRTHLVDLLGTELLHLLQPQSVVIYARQSEQVLAPVFMWGAAIPPALAVPSRLVQLCGERRWLLGWTPFGLWALPLCAASVVATWITSAVGQSLARPQMRELQSFLEGCVRRASEPPAASNSAVDVMSQSPCRTNVT